MLKEPIYRINFMENGDVLTGDGEFLGKWSECEVFFNYQFTPDGSEHILFSSPYVRTVCKKIEDWLSAKSN